MSGSKVFNDKYTKLFQVNGDVNLVNELYENINNFYEDFINYIDYFRDNPDILMRIQNVIEEYSFDMIYYKYKERDHDFIFNLPDEILYTNHKYPNKIYGNRYAIFQLLCGGDIDKCIDPKFVEHMINIGFDVNTKRNKLYEYDNILWMLPNIKGTLDNNIDLIKLIISLSDNIGQFAFKILELDITLDGLIEILNTSDKNGKLLQINKTSLKTLFNYNYILSVDIIKYLISQGCDLHNFNEHINDDAMYHVCSNINVSVEIIEYLISRGFDINKEYQRTYGNTTCLKMFKRIQSRYMRTKEEYNKILKLLES